MRNVFAITHREVRSYFASPIAYVVIASWLFVFGFYFDIYLDFFVDPRAGTGQVANVNQDMIRPIFHTSAFFLLVLLPMITMRSFAEELRSGTIELLFTSPVTDTELVLGKFLGALSLYGIMLASTLAHMGVLFYFGDPEWKPLAVGYLGMLLLGAGYIAFGLLFSSLTKSQVIAGFLTIGTFLVLYLVELAVDWGGQLSLDRHLQEFAKGVLDTRDLVFFLSLVAVGLFLARQSIESHRWRG